MRTAQEGTMCLSNEPRPLPDPPFEIVTNADAPGSVQCPWCATLHWLDFDATADGINQAEWHLFSEHGFARAEAHAIGEVVAAWDPAAKRYRRLCGAELAAAQAAVDAFNDRIARLRRRRLPQVPFKIRPDAWPYSPCPLCDADLSEDPEGPHLADHLLEHGLAHAAAEAIDDVVRILEKAVAFRKGRGAVVLTQPNGDLRAGYDAGHLATAIAARQASFVDDMPATDVPFDGRELATLMAALPVARLITRTWPDVPPEFMRAGRARSGA